MVRVRREDPDWLVFRFKDADVAAELVHLFGCKAYDALKRGKGPRLGKVA